jgi:hypothetical protein
VAIHSISEVIEMTENVQNYSYLWDGSQLGWVLLSAPDLAGGYCIFNNLKSTLLHIDDETLNETLCKRMKESGCDIVDEFESAPVDVEAVKPE